MTQPATVHAVETLINHAADLTNAGQYGPALAAAARAVEASDWLDDPQLLVRALVQEANALASRGEHGAALTRYTRVLAIAEDTGSRDRLDGTSALKAVAMAYTGWVGCALDADGIRTPELFRVLDAGEQFLHSIGQTSWRTGLLLERAALHEWLGQYEAAVAAGQEALATYRPGSGFAMNVHRRKLGDFLRRAGRVEEAEPLYQAVLDTDTGPSERWAALAGLAWCALHRGDTQSGRRHATAAVWESERLDDDALGSALEALIGAYRDAGDLDAAAAAAGRKLEVARRVGGHHRLFSALDWQFTLAVDRGQLETATELFHELHEHAAALDADTGTFAMIERMALHWGRLADLQGNR